MRRFIPIIVFAALLLLLGVGLTLKPSELPSVLIDKPLPHFNLSQLDQPMRKRSSDDMLGHVWLLNVWASWCSSCRTEHQTLMDFSHLDAAPILGLNMKDASADAQRWLAEGGNPYRAVLVDADGLTSMDLGVYGVPETFVIDRQGRVRYRHTGPLDEQSVRQTLLPLIDRLNAETGISLAAKE